MLAACGDGATAPAAGSLAVEIGGLPAGVEPAVGVLGPNGYSATVASSSTLTALRPGVYVILASDVRTGGVRYAATPPTQTIVVSSGAMSMAAVAYGIAPLELSLELVADGLTAPVFLAAPDGDPRQFVVERNGRIRIIQNGALLTTPFLDIRSRVNFTGERGLLGIAFDPQYATNGFFYVYYVDVSGDVAIERFGSTPGSNVAGASAGIVMVIAHGGANHHGGMLAFGPDSMLYAAPGDGGCCGDPNNNAQNTSTLLGKMLRVDVRTPPYTVPAGNPFIGRPGMRPEIWASGLRSPWRFSFDVPAGMLYIADVGNDAREEVNVSSMTAAGLNYGWRLMEGTACYNPTTNCNTASLTLPAHEYLHADGCSVIGGYVYRGSSIPELIGHYLYADYCRGWLRSFRLTTGGGAIDHRSWAGVTVPSVVSFGRDGAGELYMIGGTRVWRIVRW